MAEKLVWNTLRPVWRGLNEGWRVDERPVRRRRVGNQYLKMQKSAWRFVLDGHHSARPQTPGEHQIGQRKFQAVPYAPVKQAHAVRQVFQPLSQQESFRLLINDEPDTETRQKQFDFGEPPLQQIEDIALCQPLKDHYLFN